MNYRPSKWFVRIMPPLCVLTLALGFGLLPELQKFETRPVPGEITFKSEKPVAPVHTTGSTNNAASFQWSMDWMEESYEDLMSWERNPWKRNRSGFGSHYFDLLSSKDPLDQAKCRKLQRQAEIWYHRLLLRYPELAVTFRNVPDEQNGFLKWLVFSEIWKESNGDKGFEFPRELDQYLNHNGPWDAAAAKQWLAQHKSLVDEIRAIGLTPEESVNGISADRLGSMAARLAMDSARSLILEARLAAEQGDVASALQSIRAAKGLADHFTQVETPTLLGAMVQPSIQRKLENAVLTQILPALPAGQIDSAAWENMLNPTVHPTAEFARVMKGEWSATTRQYLLPMLLDADDPKLPPDGGALLDSYSSIFVEIARSHEPAKLTDLPDLSIPNSADFSHLSRTSRKAAETFSIGAGAWRKGWDRNQSASAMTQAAFAIIKNQPIPVDPVYGQSYRWDPATRQLSMPAGQIFDQMDIKPITVPEP